MTNDTIIMMIDDDPAAHIYHKIMMEEAGMKPEQALEFLDVDSGIKHLKECKLRNGEAQFPSHVIVDLNIPRKSGWDFIEELRNLNLGDKTPEVYIVSNTENPQDAKRAEALKEVVALKAKFLDKDFFVKL